MKEIKTPDFKIKVVEQSGTTLKAMLQRSDPFKQRRCVNADCMPSLTDWQEGSCRSTGVTYELVRQACKSKYVGETSRSAYTRGREHFHALERGARGKLRYVETLLWQAWKEWSKLCNECNGDFSWRRNVEADNGVCPDKQGWGGQVDLFSNRRYSSPLNFLRFWFA